MRPYNKDIFERDKAGETIRLDDPEYPKLFEVILKAIRTTAELNSLVTADLGKIREVFSRLIGRTVDETFFLIPPFYTDFGENITIGKNVFVNHACTFMDRGGITLEDGVLIGPKVNLITTNHPIKPSERRATISNPIVIKENAWIGAGATILPGVTVGENAVVAAGAVVTADVPANTVVGGIPAKIIKTIN
jgi:acetyltransferase-like isoleucine patch superfamily enzyme